MPRPNRYHPYIRNTSAPQPLSPRYPPMPWGREPMTLPPITEHISPTSEPSPIGSGFLLPIAPSDVRDFIVNWKNLRPRSIIRMSDGRFHVKIVAIEEGNKAWQGTVVDNQAEAATIGCDGGKTGHVYSIKTEEDNSSANLSEHSHDGDANSIKIEDEESGVNCWDNAARPMMGTKITRKSTEIATEIMYRDGYNEWLRHTRADPPCALF
ncbi:hypothetical protein K469DRAFT_696123 [Zopfia rhizophila CBS 207.26]|uniref:Uncharacterized protein n=1 Tax=Zopfia rhizophila CBS 207.26 TaxID=1314779 RepID=A0A6A6EMB1_9PEZI|nr:hypothetical protein K469DRAFT_696123 [Zopfia rhizophila CBS 207.26]